jgi:hypothetical protein
MEELYRIQDELKEEKEEIKKKDGELMFGQHRKDILLD